MYWLSWNNLIEESVVNKQTIFSIAAAAGLGMVAVSAQADRSEWPDSFTVGTASQGGTYFTYGSGWAKLVSDELGVPGGGEITGGPNQNLALVHTGDVAFGMTTMGPAAEALAGDSPVAPGMPLDQACAMFPMYETPFSVTVLSSSGIESIEDIPAGAAVGFGPAGSTSDTYFPRMLETLGVDFDRRNGGWSDLGSQLQDGLIDVIAFAAGVPIPAVSQLEVQTDINIIEFTDAERSQIMEAFPVAEFDIPADTYQTLNSPAQAVSMWNFSIARCDLPQDFVYEATKAVMENNDRMVEIHRAARFSVPENYDKNTVLPFHAGAAQWFEENGYDIADNMIHD